MFHKVKTLLEKSLSPGLFGHCTRVADCAAELASREGLSADTLRLAGLLHDCARELPLQEQRKLVEEDGIEVDTSVFNSTDLLHSYAGSVLARKQYGIESDTIIRAVRSHTLGCEDPTTADVIVFLADKIEPARGYDGVEEVRELAQTDCFLAAMKFCEIRDEFLREKGVSPHPVTEKFRAALVCLTRKALK